MFFLNINLLERSGIFQFMAIYLYREMGYVAVYGVLTLVVFVPFQSKLF